MGINPKTHVNALCEDKFDPRLRGEPARSLLATLRGRIAVGNYTWSGSRLDIVYSVGAEQYSMVLELSHASDREYEEGERAVCSGRLAWTEYSMIDKTGEN